MANVTKIETPQAQNIARQRSDIRFPARSLADSVVVAKAVHEKGGGKASPDQLAAFLGYKSVDNGAYLARVGAARTFGLITKSGDVFTLTSLAHQILMPTYPEESRQGLVNAFMGVELFERVFEEFKGKELPPEFGLKNALRNIFKVVPTRVDLAYRVLMESAEDAGFFATRGARTHLILPTLKASAGQPKQAEPEGELGGPGSGGGDDGGDPPQSPVASVRGQLSLDGVKARYVETLIRLFEEKSKNGELDDALMTRIEKILNIGS